MTNQATDLTDRTHPDSGRIITSSDVIADLHARIAELEQEVAHTDSLPGKANALARIRAHRIAELEAQIDAVGAGGVSLYGGDSYGDGNVYRGERSADSAVTTYTVHELAHAKGVPRLVTNAMLAMSEKLAEALDKLHVLEEVANRLSIDLECMTLDPTNAHWHDTANESLRRHRDLMDAWYPRDHVSPLGKD